MEINEYMAEFETVDAKVDDVSIKQSSSHKIKEHVITACVCKQSIPVCENVFT